MLRDLRSSNFQSVMTAQIAYEQLLKSDESSVTNSPRYMSIRLQVNFKEQPRSKYEVALDEGDIFKYV